MSIRRGTDSAIEGRQRGVSSCSSSPARRRARLSAGNPRLRVRYSERTTTAPSTPRTPLGYEHRPTDSRLDWGVLRNDHRQLEEAWRSNPSHALLNDRLRRAPIGPDQASSSHFPRSLSHCWSTEVIGNRAARVEHFGHTARVEVTFSMAVPQRKHFMRSRPSSATFLSSQLPVCGGGPTTSRPNRS